MIRSLAGLLLALSLPLAAAETSPLVFSETHVSAPVVPGADSAWFSVHLGTRRIVAAIDLRADSDGDGWARWERDLRYEGHQSIWTVVDMASGRLMAGRPPGIVPKPSAFPRKAFLRDAAGNFSYLVLDISHISWSVEGIYLMWVRPGAGAWWIETGDSYANSLDRVMNDFAVVRVSSFQPLGSAPPPSGFLPGDVLVGIDPAAETWFGGAVDAHLAEAVGGTVLTLTTHQTLSERSEFAEAVLLRREGSPDDAISLQYATEDGTATAGRQYNAVSGTLTFGPGEFAKVIRIPVIDDKTFSRNTTFTLRLTNITGASLQGPTSIPYTIANVDNPPVVRFASENSIQVSEGDGGVREVAVPVRLDGATVETATVEWFATPDAGAPNGGTLTFAPGETQKDIVFRYVGNTTPNPDVYYSISLRNPQNARVWGSSATVVVLDNDPATLSIGDVTASESAGKISVPVTLNGAISGSVGFGYSTVDGTAKAGVDYVASFGSSAISQGTTTTSIEITILSDAVAEGEETFEVVIHHVSGARLGRSRAVVTLREAQGPLPTLTIDNWAGPESSDATFTLTLSAAAPSPVTVLASTRDVNPGAAPGEDFSPRSQLLRIPAGQISTMFSVPVIDDEVREEHETFIVEFTQLTNATFAGPAFATGTIYDNDDRTTPPRLMVLDAWMDEGDSGTRMMAVRFELTAPASAPVTIAYRTADGTALAGSDYQSASGTLTFAVQERVREIAIPILGDQVHEPDERFSITILSAAGTTVVDGFAVGTIRNDDPLATKRRAARH